MKVEHENRSVVVFADHFTVPTTLIKKISDEKAGVPGCLVVDLGPRSLAKAMHSSAATQ